MTTHVERTYKSLWHLAIASIGFYELRNHKTLLSKVLACGLIAFHADAAICDAIDIPTTPQRFIKGILNATQAVEQEGAGNYTTPRRKTQTTPHCCRAH